MSNPTVECVYDGAETAMEEEVDFVIAIGGGSPMDSAKAIALLAVSDIERKNLFDGNIGNKALPMIHIPTTAGTGSEVTPYAILTRIVMPKIELTTAAASETSTEAKAGELVKQSISTIFPRACIGGFYVSADCFQNRLYQHGGGYVSTSGGEPFKHERYALQPCLQRDGSADLQR